VDRRPVSQQGSPEIVSATGGRMGRSDVRLPIVQHRHRDRHGRGLRGALAPRDVPIARTPGEAFDDLVLDAVDDLDERFARELAEVEFAVEDVPADVASDFDPDVVSDASVPLGRLYRTGLGAVTRPVVVLYRRPIEARGLDRDDRADLVFAVVAELVAELLGKDIDDIDPL